MVVLHKSKGEEVLLETMNVRFTGPGSQAQPAVAPDGTRLVVVSTNTEGNSDLWVADTVDAAPILQLTFTPDSESESGSASIVAKDGPLPIGAHTWQLGPSTLGTPGWEGRTLTVALLKTEADVSAAEQRQSNEFHYI